MGPRLKLFIPLILFAVLALFLFRGLELDPKERREDVIGEVALFNVWATWCVSCRVEHPYLHMLAEQGVPIIGLNYKDDDTDALRWLEELGNPYRVNIVDAQGTLGLDLGVYGAPETYLVDAGGVIRYRHVGVVDERVWQDILQPLYRELKTGRVN
jgi:cytochrome c biogenesis protein CcmG/thiol:disulfide interchange protein DsbE